MLNVTVIGAGTMGSGIATLCAINNKRVILYEVNSKQIEKAKSYIEVFFKKKVEKGSLTEEKALSFQSNISYTSELSTIISSDIVIEAIVEQLEIKQQLFIDVEKIVGHSCILASNTSSISITQIASKLVHQERVVGIHFFNPAMVMKLVEVISGEKTNPAIVEKSVAFCESLEKVVVKARDTPGFIVNRVARPFYSESLKLLNEQVSDVNTIDKIHQKISGFKMGPFELLDLIGIDVNLSVTKSVYESYFYEPRFRPNIIQQRMVDSGKLGRKTNIGFYKYED